MAHNGAVDARCGYLSVRPTSDTMTQSMVIYCLSRFYFLGRIGDIRGIPEFADPIPTVGKAGIALFVSSYLVHAAVRFANKKKQRAFWTLSMGPADNSRWAKLANPWVGPEREHITAFWEKTTSRVRTLFGWPPPGHHYYDDASLQNLSVLFPNMNMDSYAPQ